jgi:hypothetical protein
MVSADMSITSFWLVIVELFAVLAIYHIPVPAHWADSLWTSVIGGTVAWAKVGLVLWFLMGSVLLFGIEGGAIAGDTERVIVLFFLKHPSLALLVGPVIAVQVELIASEFENTASTDRRKHDDA